MLLLSEEYTGSWALDFLASRIGTNISQGFIWPKNLWGGGGGKKRGMLDEWAALAAQAGGCRREMCHLPHEMQEIDISVPQKPFKQHLTNFN